MDSPAAPSTDYPQTFIIIHYIYSGMGFLERVSSWLEPPSYVMYQCSHCHTVIDEVRPSCPECEGELSADPIHLDSWDGM